MIPFVKMHGCGNDFVLVKDKDLPQAGLAEQIREICHRRFGAGSDGLISLGEEQAGVVPMRMFNPDGSESGMCGNGLRCAARLTRPEGGTVDFSMGRAHLAVIVRPDGLVEVNMGLPDWRMAAVMGPGVEGFGEMASVEAAGVLWQGWVASFGNPHFVLRTESLDAVPLAEAGPALENHRAFPNRTNVHFVAVGADGLAMKTWERGAGPTLACGSGACAAAAVAFAQGWASSPVKVSVPGGDLVIEARQDGFRLIGPAVEVYRGIWLG